MSGPLDANSAAASLTGFDWGLVAVVVVSGLMAFWKGFIRVLFSIAGLVVGILLASWYFGTLAVWVGRWVVSVPTAQVLAFGMILLGTVMVFSIVAAVLRKAVKAVGLGFVDRVLGGAVGLVRGALICVAGLMGIAAFFPDSTLVKSSRLAPYFLAGAHAVSFVVPGAFERQVSAGANHLLKKDAEGLKGDGKAQ
jgi:membrane protein required for colicin V production